MDLKESLNKLKQLEKLEDKIELNKKDRDNLHLDIEEQEEKLDRLEKRREEIKEERSHALSEANKRESQMASAEEENEKLEIQRNSTKDQAKFQAMGETIASNIADIEKWETEELEFLERADELEQEAQEVNEKIDRAEKKLQEIKKRVEAKSAEYNQTIQELQEKKQSIRDEINPKVLKKYDNIARSRGSSALVQVKNRVCQGCHTMLPKQTENALLKCSDIVLCHNCGRMLMLNENDSSF